MTDSAQGRLAGKVAFITGAANGIGRETAARFVAEGAKVVIADIDRAAGPVSEAQARAKAANRGGDAVYVYADITETADVERAVAETISRFGRIDILHNNAGGSRSVDAPLTEAPEEEFWRVLKLDLYGTFLTSRHVIPQMIKSGGGSIINMSSVAALVAFPGRHCYSAAKGGVTSLTKSMAVTYAPNRIRVNAIAPSVTLTDRVKKMVANDPAIEVLAKQHLLGMGEPRHIADLAVYLASDESTVTTGQIIAVDSGVTVA
jgi:NAD(P)-dependent dehydrogenase (short-subunit alcohol dehydrogenase family)